MAASNAAPAAETTARSGNGSVCLNPDVAGLQERAPGELVAFEELTAPADPSFPPSARAWRVLYVSTGRDNRERTLICGVVVAPDDPATIALAGDGGRTGRMVAWAHGSLGLVPRCLPTTDPAFEIWGAPPFGINTVAWGSEARGDHHIGAPADGILAGMIGEGWIVTASDYYADLWGGDSLHPYVVGKVEAANVIDLFRAADHLLRRVYPGYDADAYDVVTWGHSQGGHAALWAGQLLDEYVAATASPGEPALALAGVALESPGANFITQPEQATTAPGYGLFDWLAHARQQLTGQPEPITLAPFFFSYVLASWASWSQGETSPSEMPAGPGVGPLDLTAIVTPEAVATVEAVTGVCWADGEEVVRLVAPYVHRPFFVPAVADGPEIDGYQHGNFDRTCAGDPPGPIADWCAWFRYNLPGPLGRHPFAKIPMRGGAPVPVLIAVGNNDGVVHCVTPDGADDPMPGAKDCMSVALYDALRDEYCPGGTARGHLTLQVWRPEAGVTVADHSDVTGLAATARLDDPRFDGSPLHRFITEAFAGALAPGCAAGIANPA